LYSCENYYFVPPCPRPTNILHTPFTFVLVLGYPIPGGFGKNIYFTVNSKLRLTFCPISLTSLAVTRLPPRLQECTQHVSYLEKPAKRTLNRDIKLPVCGTLDVGDFLFAARRIISGQYAYSFRQRDTGYVLKPTVLKFFFFS